MVSILVSESHLMIGYDWNEMRTETLEDEEKMTR